MKIISILPLFPETVGVYNISTDNKKILRFLNKLKWTKRNSGLGDSLDHEAYSGPTFDFLTQHRSLKKRIEECITIYIQATLKQDTAYRITTSWATKVGPGGYARIHYHCNSWLSGVYYPDGHKSFRIRFHNPKKQQWLDTPREYTINNSSTWTVPIEANTVAIFPSLLSHELLTNESNKTRYSIAFNVFPTGYIGGKDSDSSVQL